MANLAALSITQTVTQLRAPRSLAPRSLARALAPRT